MNKANGNMYKIPAITHTHNDIQGKCPHACSYCYMKKMERFGNIPKELCLSGKSYGQNLGENNFIFMGSSCDMWAEGVPDFFIYAALQHAAAFNNKYLFQTKNPVRFIKFLEMLPNNCCLGTTIETNRIYPCMGKTPSPDNRSSSMAYLAAANRIYNFETFITIEPILEFDLDQFVIMLRDAKPDFINVGSDSGNNHLPEPDPEKIRELIKELEKFTKVNLKKNLKRLLPEIKGEV